MKAERELYQIIGRKIREARKKQGLNQETLAKGIKSSRALIANVESGRQSIAIHQIYEIADYLKIPVIGFLISVNDHLKITNNTFLVYKELSKENKRLKAKLIKIKRILS